MHAELAIGKTGGQQIEHQHGIPERLHRGIGEAQCRYPLALHGPGTLELLQGLFGQNRIVRDGLDFEHTPVGLKSDVAKRRADTRWPSTVRGRWSCCRVSSARIESCVMVWTSSTRRLA